MRRKLLICGILMLLIMAFAGYFTKGLLAPKVGLCLSGADSTLEKGLRDKLVLAGYNVVSRSGENSQEKQNQQVNTLLQKDVDILVIQPVNPDAVAEILQMAVETPVVFIGSEPADLGNAYYVGCDISQEGIMQAQLLDTFFSKADINGDGVFMLAQLGISSHLYRMLPYLVTLVVLAFTSKKSRAPKAEGIPYDKGSR